MGPDCGMHVVLSTVLVPLLVEWSLLWLAEKKVVGVKDSALRSYLLYRNHASSSNSKHRDEAVMAMKGRGGSCGRESCGRERHCVPGESDSCFL